MPYQKNVIARRLATLALLLFPFLATAQVPAAAAVLPRPGLGQPFTTGPAGTAIATTVQVTAGETFRTTFPVFCNRGPARVRLTPTVVPAKFSATVEPAETDTPNESVRVTAPTEPTTPAGLYEIRVKASPISGPCVETDPFVTFSVEVVAPPVALEVVPGSQTLGLGGTVQFDVNIKRKKDFNGRVTLAAMNLPRGVTARFEPNDTREERSRLTLTAAPDARLVTDRAVDITGTANVPVRPGRLQLTVAAALGLTPFPPSLQARAGGSGNFTLRLDRVGYSGPVRLSLDVSGPTLFGLTLRTTPEGFTTLDAITVEFDVASFSLAGTYTIRVQPILPPDSPVVKLTGTEVTVEVSGPLVSLRATPPSQMVAAGGSATYTLEILRAPGFTGEVRFAGGTTVPGGMPPMPDRLVDPTRVTVTTDAIQTAPSTYTLSFNVSYRQDGRDVPVVSNLVDLVVGQSGGVKLSTNGMLQSVRAGRDLGYLVDVQRLGNFRGRVALDLQPPPPAPITFRFDTPEVAAADSDAVLTLTIPAGTPPGGPYNLQITGETRDPTGLPVQFAPIQFEVLPPNPPTVRLVAVPSQLDLREGQTGVVQIAVVRESFPTDQPVDILGPDFPPSPAILEFELRPAGFDHAELEVTNRSVLLDQRLEIRPETPGNPNVVRIPVTVTIHDPGGIQPLVTLAASPPAQSVQAGGTATYALTLGGSAGQPVQLAATGVPPGAAATFAPNPATGGSSTLAVAVPAATPPGTYRLTLSAGVTGQSPATAAVDLTVVAAPPLPTISGFSPTSGPPGTLVTVTGTNFNGVGNVSFNGVSTSNFTVLSPTQLRVTVPGFASTGPIRVATPAGTATSAGVFTIGPGPLPTISSFFPTSGPPGTSVTINGTNFNVVGDVRFGGFAAAYAVISSTTISATVPPNAVTGPITVTTSSGTATSPVPFTVTTSPAGPTISSFSPTSGPPTTVVTILGTNFNNVTIVSFNGVSTSNYTVVSSTQIQVTVPGFASTGPIRVTTPAGTATSAGNFTVAAGALPTISSLSPASGPPGTLVTINGANFTGVGDVRFGGFPAAYAVLSPAAISATVPGSATTGPVTVVTASGTATSPVPFTVTPSPAGPTISSFSPTSGPPTTVVTILGTNFNNVTNVSFNGVSTSNYTVVSSTQIQVTVPGFASTGPIRVTTPAGTATSAGNFTVAAGPLPTISSLSPASGPPGTLVTINGANFTGVGDVRFGGFPAAYAVLSPAAISATVPGSATTGPVTVVTASGTATSPVPFTVTTSPSGPAISSFFPASGPPTTIVTILGSNFTGATNVSFNGVSTSNYTIFSSTEIRVVVPGFASTGPIRVTTPAGTATSAGSYTVTPFQ